MKIVFAALVAAVLLYVLPQNAFGQTVKKKRKGTVYLSWGYNKEWYTKSNVSINQPALANNYRFVEIRAHDHPGWDDGIFNKAISIPQYNYRLGFIFDEKKGWGFEVNFDHTKYIFGTQNAHLTGTLNGKQVDTTIAFGGNDFYWFLNNGANFLLFNITKKTTLATSKSGNASLSFLGKFGVGPVIPHVQNALFGQPNDPHFQFGGWNTGAEGSLRGTFYKVVYLELSNKVDYARYSGLKVYDGTGRQAFGTYEWILSLGLQMPFGGKR